MKIFPNRKSQLQSESFNELRSDINENITKIISSLNNVSNFANTRNCNIARGFNKLNTSTQKLARAVQKNDHAKFKSVLKSVNEECDKLGFILLGSMHVKHINDINSQIRKIEDSYIASIPQKNAKRINLSLPSLMKRVKNSNKNIFNKKGSQSQFSNIHAHVLQKSNLHTVILKSNLVINIEKMNSMSNQKNINVDYYNRVLKNIHQNLNGLSSGEKNIYSDKANELLQKIDAEILKTRRRPLNNNLINIVKINALLQESDFSKTVSKSV